MYVLAPRIGIGCLDMRTGAPSCIENRGCLLERESYLFLRELVHIGVNIIICRLDNIIHSMQWELLYNPQAKLDSFLCCA